MTRRRSSVVPVTTIICGFSEFERAFVLSLVLLLSKSNLTLSQENTTQVSPYSLSGKLCCPRDHFWDADAGKCFHQDGSVFHPDDIPLITSSNITWSYQPLKCISGYSQRVYSLESTLGLNTSALTETEDGIVLEYQEILNARSQNYCVGALPNRNTFGVVCRPNASQICDKATCVQRCCGKGGIFNFNSFSCEFTHIDSPLKFQSVSGVEVSQPLDLHVIIQFPDCQSVTLVNVSNPEMEFYLLPDGILYLPATDTTYYENKFCVENMLFQGSDVPVTAAFVCSEPGLPVGPTPTIYAYSSGVILSAVFLLVTIIFHIFIPKLRDMQGLCLLSHVISLFVADLALVVGYLFSGDIHHHHCVINGFILQYSLMAAFFWLNVMCYDIWRVIRATVNIIPLTGILANDSKRFKFYSLYAWGWPFVVSLITILLHYVPQAQEMTRLTPGFGVVNCWFHGDLERFLLFYGPIAVLFVGNIVLLCHTTAMLYQAGAAFLFIKRKMVPFSSCNRGHLDAFWHRFSLFMLMALCWITEILSWKIKPEEIWYLTDYLNTLQGFFVFVIFISYKKKADLVKELLLKCLQGVTDAGRKLSRSEDTGVAFYASKSTSSTYGTQDDQTKQKTPVEPGDTDTSASSTNQDRDIVQVN
ncbi:hypothetical protein SK128_025584 [Halocaridina rubra]|uniref:G-protein coupled receptors family 2 profile 2 domain-containing protein n=1 Tax=Halocaridina rubra TaxID=373956 RepID=A0AAN8ZPF1_HALRR